jgi:hypothetical protein
MAGRRQRISPIDAALARLAELAGRGVTPSRLAREVDVIMAGWLSEASPDEPEEVAERLAAMHENLAAGAAAAAEQLSDIDADDPAALRHARLVHAALEAGVEAVERAREAQRNAATAAPRLPEARLEPVLAAPALSGSAVTIDPLAGRNPLGVDQGHPVDLRPGVATERAPAEGKAGRARGTGQKRISTRDQQETITNSLL